jgi:hypothetical protein
LEDCGVVTIEAKIRVMPTCWFVLLKFFLRIDGVVVRTRETRLYHAFPREATSEAIQVHCEVLWREESLGGIDNIVGYESALHPSTAAPFRTVHLRTSKDDNKDMPIVNEKEGVHQYYTLLLPHHK